MKPVFYNSLGQPVFDAYQPEGPVKLEVICLCEEDFHKHICHSACPDAIEYDGIGSDNPDWQG